MKEVLDEKIRCLITPFFEELSTELVALDIQQRKQGLDIKILADKPQGGITLEECVRLNKKINNAIQQGDFSDQNFSLDVSSPGLDRLLKTNRDFLRALNQEVWFLLFEPIEGNLEHVGRVKKVEENYVIIDSSQGEINIPNNKINKAKQVI